MTTKTKWTGNWQEPKGPGTGRSLKGKARPMVASQNTDCPTCGAGIGQPCRSTAKRAYILYRHHPERIRSWKQLLTSIL